jgi:curved DNA-binding protein CbpA
MEAVLSQATRDEDYYAVLGCTPDAALDDIQSHYRKLLLQHHPDKCRPGHDLTGSSPE